MAATTEHLSNRKAAPAGSAPLLWARLGSLLSVLPLGVWTLNHLADNLSAYSGAEAWQRQVTSYSSPISHGITLFVVLGPLLIHMVWGLQRMFTFRPNNVAYSTWGNTRYIVQRVAGVGVLFFLGAHIWLAMLQPRLVHGHPEEFNHIAAAMFHHGPTLMVYLLGSLGVAYHLANGVSTFAWQWGLVSGRSSLGRFDVLAAVIIVVTLCWRTGRSTRCTRRGRRCRPSSCSAKLRYLRVSGKGMVDDGCFRPTASTAWATVSGAARA